MKQTYTKVNTTGNYAKEPLKIRQMSGFESLLPPVNKSSEGQKNYHQSAGAKNDSMIMQDFFGALNYGTNTRLEVHL